MFMIIFKNCNICGWWWWLINQIGDNCDWSCNDCVFFCDSCCWHCKNSDHIKCSIIMMPPTAFFAIWITNKSQAIRCSDHWITTALPSKSRHSKLSVAEPVCSDKKYPKYIGNKKKTRAPKCDKDSLTWLSYAVSAANIRIIKGWNVFQTRSCPTQVSPEHGFGAFRPYCIEPSSFYWKRKKMNGVQNSMLLMH